MRHMQSNDNVGDKKKIILYCFLWIIKRIFDQFNTNVIVTRGDFYHFIIPISDEKIVVIQF